MTLIDTKIACFHCGDDCPDNQITIEDKHFCCNGCKTVYEILQESDLCNYYDLNQHAGTSLKAKNFNGKYDYLIDEKIQAQLLDFQSETINKVTLYIPAIHCSSCVWLLENFNKIQKGVFTARLNFLKKELSISYNPQQVSLLSIVELLTTLGYEPNINLQSIDNKVVTNKVQRKLILQIGVVGFCLGNIMLLSFPEYFKFDLKNSSDFVFQKVFLYLNFFLALPVFFFGASDYLNGAILSLKENFKKNTNILSVDIPIAMAITTLFARSCYETFINQTAGYWDSMTGLVFFLLVGKWVQQTTFNYLSFERNYKSYFPLAVKIAGEKGVFKNISELKVGDIIEIHNQEIIPADALLLSHTSLIDYSFVTGESQPVEKGKNDLIFAGGRQIGGKIELIIQKTVSQSYLTELWNNDSFKKTKPIPTTELANAFSKYFTYITLIIALLSGIYWYFNEPNLVWKTVTAVLMVACPCALTLSLPFTMNATMSIFGKNKFFVKNQSIIQLLTEINEVVFDKTGTLTENKNGKIRFEDGVLCEEEKSWIAQMAAQSVHPMSRILFENLTEASVTLPFESSNRPQERVQNSLPFGEGWGGVSYFSETKGSGIEGIIDGNFIRIGSKDFIGIDAKNTSSSQVFVEINREYRGYFTVKPSFRKNWKEVLLKLKTAFRLALLSGDNEAEKENLKPFFEENKLHFNQKPQDKLNFIAAEQANGNHVLMIGDGLNDAGALRQSNVGIALSEDTQAFSPACDAILDASKFSQLTDFLSFSKIALNIVKASFVLSMVYNFVGIGWAVSGKLSPVMAAIFMPLSSLSVVLFAVGLTYLFAKIKKLN